MTHSEPARARGPAGDRLLFATLAAVTTVTAVVSSLGAPLVPSIAGRYDVPLSTAQWVLTATLVAAAAATPTLGRWGSGRLRRPVILGTLVVVLAGTVLSALPLGIGTLIAGRGLQGAGIALAPLTMAVARDVWTGPALASRLSLLSVATVAGAGLGYPVSGFLAEHAGVSGAYWFGTAVTGLTLALATRFLPRNAAGAPQPVDLPSVLLVAGGTTGVLLAVSQGERWGWTTAAVLGPAAGGVVLLLAWLGRTRRLAARGRQPLVDLELAARPGVLGPNAVAFTLAVAMYGLLTVVVLLASNDPATGWGLGAGAGAVGLLLVPYAVLSVTGSRLALRLARNAGPQWLLPIGCAVFASAIALLTWRHHDLTETLVVMAVGGLGSGFTFSSLPMLIVPHVPPSETGSAMAFNLLLRYLGFAVGSAASVALLDVLGGDETAFRSTCLALAGLCLAAGAGVVLGGRRSSTD